MQLPTLPNQFEAWITANIVNRNYTVVVHEVYDGPGNRLHVARYHGGMSRGDDPDHGFASTIYMYDIDEYIHQNGTTCLAYPLSTMGRRTPFGGHDHHIPSTHQFFAFAQEGQTEVYMGQQRVNGIPCDWWRSEQSTNFTRANSTSMMTMTLDYFFSAEGWRNPMANGACGGRALLARSTKRQLSDAFHRRSRHAHPGPAQPDGQSHDGQRRSTIRVLARLRLQRVSHWPAASRQRVPSEAWHQLLRPRVLAMVPRLEAGLGQRPLPP